MSHFEEHLIEKIAAHCGKGRFWRASFRQAEHIKRRTGLLHARKADLPPIRARLEAVCQARLKGPEIRLLAVAQSSERLLQQLQGFGKWRSKPRRIRANRCGDGAGGGSYSAVVRAF